MKGFLKIQEEIKCIEQINQSNRNNKLGVMLNWARSVIEEKDSNTVINHINLANSKNLLRGFIFSGTSNDASSPYLYFGDRHAPPPTPYKDKIYAEDSIMTTEAMQSAINLFDLKQMKYFGFKIMPLPLPENPDDCMLFIDYMLLFLDSIVSKRLQ